MRVIVTGCSGYIGGQIALDLKDQGHEVLGIDRQPLPAHLESVPDRFLCQDYSSSTALSWTVYHRPDAVVHCAADSLVQPSTVNPSSYYHNNVANFLQLLDTVRQDLPNCRVVFSSSASVYGEPKHSVSGCVETDQTQPISAYGASKLAGEYMLEHFHRAYGLNYVAFRYFNACGADSQGRHGQAPGASHIVARVLESIRDHNSFTLYGTNYATHDGTCVRDYIHVEDIARAHILALDSRLPQGVYNLGSGCATSNQQVIQRALTTTNGKLTVINADVRPGDPAVLIANSGKFDNTVRTGWRRHTIDSVISTAWQWYTR